jgi:hypothetical protein
VNSTAVFFTPSPGTSQPTDQPWTFDSSYNLSGAGPSSSNNSLTGEGAIASADFLGDGRQETVLSH